MKKNTLKKLNFLGYTFSPLKEILNKSFSKLIVKHGNYACANIKYSIEREYSLGYEYRDILKNNNINRVPDVIAGAGFGDLFNIVFKEKFVDKGFFTRVTFNKINKDFVALDLRDPKGCYNIYSVMPYVMVIDKKKLGDLPRPERWSDIIKDIYKDKVIVGDSVDDINEILLLHIFKDFGEEGLKKLAHNVKDAYHPAKMVRDIVSSSYDGSAINIMPWFYAQSCLKSCNIEIVWPEDGAIINPMYLIAKANKLEKMNFIIDYITGESYGKKSAKNYFPVINGRVDNCIPNGAVLKWIGWDFIYSRDIIKTIDYVQEVFRDNWENNYMDKLMVL